MADVIKVLAQLAAAATTPEDFYTAPDLSQVTCSSLVVCNRTTGALTFRVSVAKAGVVAADAQYLFYDVSLAANSTMTATIGITLAQDDVIRTYASATGLSFNLFGVETT